MRSHNLACVLALLLLLPCGVVVGCAKKRPPPPRYPPPGVVVPLPPPGVPPAPAGGAYQQPAPGERLEVGEPMISQTHPGSWKLKIKVSLAREPQTGHVPMQLRFVPQGGAPIVHWFDMGFQGFDGRMHRAAKATVKLEASRGFTPGVYQLQALRQSSAAIGAPVRIELR